MEAQLVEMIAIKVCNAAALCVEVERSMQAFGTLDSRELLL